MPYIKQSLRPDIDEFIDMVSVRISDEGSLNYAITRLFLNYINIHKYKNYKMLNSLIGVFECAKLEFYRRVVAPYENEKIVENGDVYGNKS